MMPTAALMSGSDESKTAGLTGRIDAATLALILDELRTTGDRDAAIRQVAQLYGCHWDAAEVLVGRIERRYRRSQQIPWLRILIIVVSVLLVLCVVLLSFRALV